MTNGEKIWCYKIPSDPVEIKTALLLIKGFCAGFADQIPVLAGARLSEIFYLTCEKSKTAKEIER